MPRTRGVEEPQRPSLTGLPHLRTSISDRDKVSHRPLTEISPRLLGHRTPRGTQSGPGNEKKLGTRISDLETQLVNAQNELKNLKHHLSSVEVVKKGVKKTASLGKPRSVNKPRDEDCKENSDTVEVFEVPVGKMLVGNDKKEAQSVNSDKREAVTITSELSGAEKRGLVEIEQSVNSGVTNAENPGNCDEVTSKHNDVEEKEKEKQRVIDENQSLKQQLEEAKSHLVEAQSKEEQLTAKLRQLGKELEASKAKEAKLTERLRDVEVTKQSMESEMTKMKVQTEQWKKAADEAASVLAGRVEINGRISHRGAFNNEPQISGFGGFIGSPGRGENAEDGFGREKKRNSGIRMIGDLWKRKGQK